MRSISSAIVVFILCLILLSSGTLASFSEDRDGLTAEDGKSIETEEALSHSMKDETSEELEWFDVQLHSHSTYSDGWSTPGELMEKAAEANLDGLALTDHHTVEGCDDPEFVETDGVMPIRGEEWGSTDSERSKGHALIWGLDQTIPSDPELNATEMVEEAKEQDALVAPAHPHLDQFPWEWGYDLDFDAFEVWNFRWDFPFRDGGNEEALQDWHDLLVEGRRITAVGGSDFHGHFDLEDLESPLVAVAAENHSQEAILEGIEAGRVMVKQNPSQHPEYTRDELYFRADGTGDGVYESMVGENVSIYERELPVEIPFELTVRNRSGSFVHLQTKEGHTETIKEVTSDDWVYHFNKSFAEIDDFDFLRAEVRDETEKDSDVYALTNPIWINIVGEPEVKTEPVEISDFDSATLQGELTTLGKEVEAEVSFRYRKVEEKGWSETSRSVKNTVGIFTEELSGLEPFQKYEFRARAAVGGEEIRGERLVFVPAHISKTTQVQEEWEDSGAIDDLRIEEGDLLLDISERDSESYVEEGERISKPLSLESLDQIGESLLAWNATTLEDTEVRIYTAVTRGEEPGEDGWRKATEGEPIPGLDEIEDTDDKYLWTKQHLALNGSEESPRLHTITEAISETPRVDFEVENLRVEPDEISVQEETELKVDVVNHGRESGNHTVEFYVEGSRVGSHTVMVEGGGTETAAIIYEEADPGTYQVEVEGLSSEFIVYDPSSSEGYGPWLWITSIVIVGILILTVLLFSKKKGGLRGKSDKK